MYLNHLWYVASLEYNLEYCSKPELTKSLYILKRSDLTKAFEKIKFKCVESSLSLKKVKAITGANNKKISLSLELYSIFKKCPRYKKKDNCLIIFHFGEFTQLDSDQWGCLYVLNTIDSGGTIMGMLHELDRLFNLNTSVQ